FNDYMNCLWGDPTEAKELPLIASAAKVGCEYFVIDAGWYAEANEDWSQTIGAWEPPATRWPRGLKFVLDQVRQAGMVPGLWLEPGRGREIPARKEAGQLVPDAAWEKGVEEFALYARLPQSGSALLSRPGNREARE